MNHERTILITGASGLLGRALMVRLATSERVTGVSHSQTEGPLISVDLRENDSLETLLRETKPEIVVHCAAYRDPDFCEEHPVEARQLNLAPVERFSELLPESARLLFISTDYVFDGGAAPYAEEDERHPVNEYGRLKVEAEDLVLQRAAGSVLRIPLLIGAGPTWETSGFIYKTMAAIRDTTPSSLDDVGIRFPTWTEDVAEAVAHHLEFDGRGIYHCSSLQGGTKYGWASELADMAGLTMDHIAPDPEGSPTRAARPGNTQLAVNKIRNTGFDRFTPFRDVARSVMRQFS